MLSMGFFASATLFHEESATNYHGNRILFEGTCRDLNTLFGQTIQTEKRVFLLGVQVIEFY
jgi:hypothetical protein